MTISITGRGRRHLAAALAIAIAACALPAISAAPIATSFFGGATELSDAELSGLRAGFQVGNVELAIGATVVTLINGATALVSNLVFDGDEWTITDTTAFGENLPPGTTVLSTFTNPETGETAFGIALDGATGLLIRDGEGTAALLHTLPDGTLANVLMNELSGQDFEQTMSIQIGILNFSEITNQLQTLQSIDFGNIGLPELIQSLP